MALKICVINCWYGTYPWYFPFFLHGCFYNPTVDFYIITDNKAEILNSPINVKFIYKPLDEIRIIASRKLGFIVKIDFPYKLCDFKPAYGFLFYDIIKKYDFWGAYTGSKQVIKGKFNLGKVCRHREKLLPKTCVCCNAFTTRLLNRLADDKSRVL